MSFKQTRLQESGQHLNRRSELIGAGRRSRVATPQKPSVTALEAAGIQQSLSRTQALLKNELERVSHVSAAIQEDGKLLQQTSTMHQTMNVKGAKQALTALERAQQHEERILLASVAFFWVAVMYILWERLLTRVPLFDRLVSGLVAILNQVTMPKP